MRAELAVVMANVAVVALQALALLLARVVENARDGAARRRGEDRYRSVKRSRRKRGDVRPEERAPASVVDAPECEPGKQPGNATRWASPAPGVR